MISLLTSAIAGVLVVAYLGYYAIRLHTPVLWLIILAVLAMVITDFVLTARDQRRQAKKRDSGRADD